MDLYSIVRPAPRTLSAFKEFFEQMASESISSDNTDGEGTCFNFADANVYLDQILASPGSFQALYDDEDDGRSASDDAETRAIAAFLLDRGADPNRHDGAFGSTGLTPLHKAARMGDAQLVRLLLDRGADWNRIDYEYNIPGAHARTQECRDLLRRYGVEDEYTRWLQPFSKHVYPPAPPLRHLFLQRKPRSNRKFVASVVKYIVPQADPSETVMMSDDGSGIMLQWETPLMQKSADLLCEGWEKASRDPKVPLPPVRKPLSVLNIGFGLGIIDGFLSEYQPVSHTIIEPVPKCLAAIRKMGWYDTPGVRILEGRWQDFIGPRARRSPETGKPVIEDLGRFDAIYFDTFEEGLIGHVAFAQHVPGLLRDKDSKFSFFHGHCAKDAALYEVASDVIEMQLNDWGMRVDWTKHSMAYPTLDEHRTYRIPICQLAPTTPRTLWTGLGGWRGADGPDPEAAAAAEAEDEWVERAARQWKLAEHEERG